MPRRSSRSDARTLGFVVLTVGVVLAASCADNGTITRSAAPQQLRTSTTVASAPTPESDTSVASETTTAVPAPSPSPAPAPVPSPAPAPVPATPALPGEGGASPGDPTAAPGSVVRPPAEWLGFGVPKPGSMFENLTNDPSLDGRGPVVGLTFDDGPSQYTAPIVDILRFLGVQATFFQISNQAAKHPEVVRVMTAAGMRIGAHSKSHPHLDELDPASQADQVLGSIDELATITGPGIVKCFRPPYANYDQNVIDLVRSRDASVAMWSYDTLDWKKPAWTSLAERVVRDVKDRQIILMHDGGGDRTATVQALPWIIQGLRQRGFTIIPVC